MKEAKNNFWQKNKKHILTYGIVFLVAGALTTVVVLTSDKTRKPKPKPKKTGGNTANSFCKYDDSFPLRYGSCGENVKAFQRMAKRKGADLGTSGDNKDGVDGKYGRKTKAAALKYYQTAAISPQLAQTLNIA